MNKISMMAMGFAVMAVLGGGCDVVAPIDAGQPAASTPDAACAPRTKHFVRITAGMDFFAAVQACAEMGGSLGRPHGAAEQQAFYTACHEGLYEPTCWTAYAKPDTVFEMYREDILALPVCEVWQ